MSSIHRKKGKKTEIALRDRAGEMTGREIAETITPTEDSGA